MNEEADVHILEDSMLGSPENFRRTLLCINDGVYMTDRQRRIVLWNPACERITGYSAGEVLGSRCCDNILNHIDQSGNQLCKNHLCPLWQAMEKCEPSNSPITVQALRKDGSRVELEVSVAPLLGENGSVIGGVEVFRDITEKRVAATLKANYLSGVTHELKRPLTIIQGFLELLLAGDAGKINGQQEEFIQSALEEGYRFRKVLDDLLDLARFEATEFSFVKQEVNLGALLNRLASGFSGEAARKEIHLSFEAAQGIVIWGDWDRLYQVMANLLSNALKYTEKGSIKVSARPEGDVVLISVQDTGIGIPDAEQDRVFDQFYRSDNELTRRIGGTGMGLSIARQIVERHGGSISVSSVPGGGSVFTVALPRRG